MSENENQNSIVTAQTVTTRTVTETTTETTEDFVLGAYVSVFIRVQDVPENISLAATLQEYDYNNNQLIGEIDNGTMVLNDPNNDNRNQVYFRPTYRGRHYQAHIDGRRITFNGQPCFYIPLDSPHYFEIEGVISPAL
ncbi:hypothetical protein EZY14_009055 [Kordia sp. TARA_039_SRF]|nr:hypothetical protein EZY14_009055 [Kordia sp. TARA_039_SRF]